jgi:hypothetical protein
MVRDIENLIEEDRLRYKEKHGMHSDSDNDNVDDDPNAPVSVL